MNNLLIKSFLFLSVLALFACTKVAGTDEETNSIAGVMADATGSPLKGVSVSAHTTSLALYADTTTYSDTTDKEGRFALNIRTQGTYGITAITDSSAYYSVVQFAGEPVELGARLHVMDSIEGTIWVRPDSVAIGAFVVIPGSPWKTETDANGHFSLKHIPIGNYFVAVKSPSPGYVMDSYYWISLQADVIAADTANVDTTSVDSSVVDTIKSTGPLSSNKADVQFLESSADYLAAVSVAMPSINWVLPLSPEYAIAGYWPMDYLTSTGTNTSGFNDAHGFTGVATAYGASLDSGRTGYGFALALKNADQFAVIENDGGALDSATAFTVELWVYVKDLLEGSEDSVYSKNIFGKLGYSDTSVFSLAVIKGMCGAEEASVAFFLADGSGTPLNCESVVVDENPLKLNTWVNLVAVWDGSTMVLYRDGALAGSVSTTIKKLSTSKNVALYFGKENLNIKIDDVRWSTTAITFADVFYRYNE